MPTFLTRPVLYAIAAAIMALLAWVLVAQLTGGKRAQTEAKLNRNQAGAAVQSGQDAVNTVGAQQASEAASDELTRSNEKEIRSAPGAGFTVNPLARDAGIKALCRRKVYENAQKCAKYRQ